VVAAPREQVRQAAPLCRGLGMQREMHPLDPHAVFPLEPLNTHGTEIAPGSDVVGEDFYIKRFGHRPVPLSRNCYKSARRSYQPGTVNSRSFSPFQEPNVLVPILA